MTQKPTNPDPLATFIAKARGLAGFDGVRIIDYGAGIFIAPVVDYSEEGIREWERRTGSEGNPVDDAVKPEAPKETKLERMARQAGITIKKPGNT